MKSARDRWFEILAAERERRHDAALMVDGRNPREALLETLATIRERMMADPHFEPPDPEESSRILDKWFKKRCGR